MSSPTLRCPARECGDGERRGRWAEEGNDEDRGRRGTERGGGDGGASPSSIDERAEYTDTTRCHSPRRSAKRTPVLVLLHRLERNGPSTGVWHSDGAGVRLQHLNDAAPGHRDPDQARGAGLPPRDRFEPRGRPCCCVAPSAARSTDTSDCATQRGGGGTHLDIRPQGVPALAWHRLWPRRSMTSLRAMTHSGVLTLSESKNESNHESSEASPDELAHRAPRLKHGRTSCKSAMEEHATRNSGCGTRWDPATRAL